MLRLLQSNQPAAWVVVPLTAVLLWCISAMERGVIPGGEEALAFAGVLASSRAIHLAHLESRMRTRPNSIPGWVFVLCAVPLIADSPVRMWWSGFFVLASLRFALRVPEGEAGRKQVLFWMGVCLCISGVLWHAMSVWSLLLPLGCIGLRPFRAAETLSLLLGLVASWGTCSVLLWLLRAPFPFVQVEAGMQWADWRILWVWVLVACIGWLFRQRSLARATARQRSARHLTQWMSVAGFGLALLVGSWGAQWSALLVFGGALFCTWTVGWCCPPRWKGTPYVPWALLILASVSAAWPMVLRW